MKNDGCINGGRHGSNENCESGGGPMDRFSVGNGEGGTDQRNRFQVS